MRQTRVYDFLLVGGVGRVLAAKTESAGAELLVIDSSRGDPGRLRKADQE